MKKKLLLLINPVSGKAKIRRDLLKILNFYTSHGYFISVYISQKRGDLHQFMSSLKEQFDIVVCIGGDGTLNETASGIIESGEKRLLAYLPNGSTNDFARSLGIPDDLSQQLSISISEHHRNIDIGKFNERHFVYVAAFGIFTNLSYCTPQKNKNILGYLAYLLEGIKQLPELKSQSAAIRVEETTIQDDFLVGLVTNSSSIAGLKNPFSEHVKLDDGLFEIILIRRPDSIFDLQEIITSLLNRTKRSKYIVYSQAAEIYIHSNSLAWTLDGEFGGCYNDVHIVNQTKSLKICC